MCGHPAIFAPVGRSAGASGETVEVLWRPGEAAIWACQVAWASLRRLWQMVCSSHSPCAPSMPRSRRNPACWRTFI